MPFGDENVGGEATPDEGTVGETQVGISHLTSPDLDRVYEALCHPRRRLLCNLLRERGTWSIDDLATAIAAREHDVPADVLDDERRDRVYVALHHAHVPKLVDCGVVTLDESGETVTPGRHADGALTVLDSTASDHESDDRPRGRRRVALDGGGWRRVERRTHRTVPTNASPPSSSPSRGPRTSTRPR